ncbi:MAG: hypothetical protein NUV76_00115 [Candidatus Kuenenia sp.]|nr:hypothetical protein [Candidatus Kuenenia sp.]
MHFNEAQRHNCFSHQLETIVKKFHQSEKSIKGYIKSIPANPFQGVRVPGLGHSFHLRKQRIPLKEYKIGARGGLRIIYLVDESNHLIYFISIYCKNDYKKEAAIVEMIKNNLKSILQG